MPDVDGLGVVLSNLERYTQNMHSALHDAADEIAKLLENHAKSNHPWQDRSGATTASTRGEIAEETKDYVLIALSAGMEYDVFLELAHQGKWAWLLPSLTANEANIRSIIVRHLGAVGV